MAYDKFKGQKAHLVGVEFGESIHWNQRVADGALAKFATTWKEGVFLGVKGKRWAHRRHLVRGMEDSDGAAQAVQGEVERRKRQLGRGAPILRRGGAARGSDGLRRAWMARKSCGRRLWRARI